jgi:hypothetical protein
MNTVFSVRGLIIFIMIGGMILCLTLTDTTTETPNVVINVNNYKSIFYKDQ